MKNIRISIIIPSYHQGKYIENAILSVLNQDYREWELIIQDGNSIDETESICARYARMDSRIQFSREPDKGFADAVNKALQKSTGLFVGIQSSDDFYATKDVFSQLLQIYQRYPSLIMIGGYAVKVDHSFRQVIIPDHAQENGFIRPSTVFTLQNHFSQGAMFFSRERARHVNGLDCTVDMVADTDFWIRMANYQPVFLNGIFRTSQVWGCVTVHENQRSNSYDRFYLGRAKMAIKHVRDVNIALDERFKFQNAVNLINAAYSHYSSIGMKAVEIEHLCKELTHENMQSLIKPKSSFSIIGAMKRLHRLGKSFQKERGISGSMNDLSRYPTGYNLKWF